MSDSSSSGKTSTDFATDIAGAEESATGMIGRYQVVRQLSSGGMGSLFLARTRDETGFEKFVALKTIHPHLARDENYVSMFLDEARIAARITHPNVCSVFDMGKADGTYYMAMDYLVGEPLHRLIRLVRKHPDKAGHKYDAMAAFLVAGAADGLHAAHELRDPRGIAMQVVHRDICPQNIFVSFDGNPRVIDFGIAKATLQQHHTATGMLKGHFAYMSPEQITGGKVDRRADIWALGVVLWEMLARDRLFAGKELPELMGQVVYVDIKKPSAVWPGIPPELDEICLRALDRDADKRFATAREFSAALNDFLNESQVRAGMHDVAAWLTELFPGEEEKRLRMLRSMPPVRPRKDRETERQPPNKTKKLMVYLVGAASLLAVGAGIATFAANGTSRPQAVETLAEEIEPMGPKPTTVTPATEVGTPSGEIEPMRAKPIQAKPAQAEPRPKNAERKWRRKRSRAAKTPTETPAEQATKPPARETANTSQKGTVRVMGIGGWASVHFGGKRLGNTPLRVELPTGKQRLELRPNGTGSPKFVTVDVKADAVAVSRVRLVE